MVETCPTCHQPLPARRISADDLRAWCVANSHFVTVDDAVYESTAALILDRSPGTLKNWRSAGCGPVWFGRRTARVRYRLQDLCDFLNSQRHDD